MTCFSCKQQGKRTGASAAGPGREVSGSAVLFLFTMSNSQTLGYRLRGTPIQRHSSFPAALAAPRVSFLLLPSPRGWRSADRRVVLVVAALVRRGAHLAIGALASRRSAVTVLGPRSPRALRFRHCRRHRREGLAVQGIKPWPAVALNLPDRTLPGRHARSIFRIVSGDAPHRAGCASHTPTPICSQ
jgi:hypothetical protein